MARRRIEEFTMTFVHHTPDDLRNLLDRYRCKYLLVDRYWWGETTYLAGISDVTGLSPPPDSCYSLFCSQNKDTLENVPGYRLLYRSPGGIRRDRYRLFILE